MICQTRSRNITCDKANNASYAISHKDTTFMSHLQDWLALFHQHILSSHLVSSLFGMTSGLVAKPWQFIQFKHSSNSQISCLVANSTTLIWLMILQNIRPKRADLFYPTWWKRVQSLEISVIWDSRSIIPTSDIMNIILTILLTGMGSPRAQSILRERPSKCGWVRRKYGCLLS